MRACIEPHCPELTHDTRCPKHERTRDRARGTTTQRGYGAQHQRARTWLARMVDPECGYCGRPIAGRWVAAHRIDGNPEAGWMHAHPTCNERAKRKANFLWRATGR